jgi:hypothetical protein
MPRPLRQRDARVRHCTIARFAVRCALMPWGDDGETGMVTDAVLWLLLVAMMGWVACGCYATRPRPIQQRYDDRPLDRADRAA